MTRTPEYEVYHQRVVEAMVSLMGEDEREFWDGCTYFLEFEQGAEPGQIAQDQLDAHREIAGAEARKLKQASAPGAAPVSTASAPKPRRRTIRII
jgi:hypothetical protein